MTPSSPTLGLDPVPGRGWRTGLMPLTRAGFGAWWRTKDWWIQSLLWTAVINGSLTVVVWGDAPDEVDAFTLYGVMTMFAAIAVAILMQEAIVGEKRSGTAAWVHSKPVSRQAFIVSKLIPNAVGVLVTMIAIPTVVVFLQFTLADIGVSTSGFVLGASVAGLNLVFYLTLTLMLGTVFDGSGPVIAIPLAFAFGQQLISGIPGLGGLLPWALVVGVGDSETSVVGALMSGAPVPNVGAIAFASVACVVFVAVALWKWTRTEL